MSPRVEDALPVEEALARVPLFSHLVPRDLKKLARLCVPRSFAAGDRIIEEGSTALGMYVLIAGEIEVFKSEGKDEGGEIALIDDRPRSASAVALEATECLLLTKDSFDLLVKKEPDIAWCIVPSLAERVRELHLKAITAEERVRELESGEATDGGDETEDSSWESAASRLMRAQYGLMMGGVAAMTGFADLWEKFMTTLADETDLGQSDNMSDLAGKLPDGLISATRAMLEKMEDVPQDVLDAFRKHTED